MKTRNFSRTVLTAAATFLLALMAFMARASVPGGTPPNDRAETSVSCVVTAAPVGAQAVDEAWRKAITANNLDAIMAVYSENAVMWLPDAPEAKGREAIRKSYVALLAANTVTGATFANTHYKTSGNLSVGWGDFTLTLSPKSGGGPVTLSGRFSVVARKEAGTWVYVVDHASTHPAPPKPR